MKRISLALLMLILSIGSSAGNENRSQCDVILSHADRISTEVEFLKSHVQLLQSRTYTRKTSCSLDEFEDLFAPSVGVENTAPPPLRVVHPIEFE